MSLIDHPNIGDITRTMYLRGQISSLPVNQNDDLATVSLDSGGSVSCGFLFHPFWDFGSRSNLTPKGASGAFFEGDRVIVKKTGDNYHIVTLETPPDVSSKERISFNLDLKEPNGDPITDSEDIEVEIYEMPGFISITKATFNSGSWNSDSEGNPRGEYISADQMWRIFLPNNYVPNPGATNFVIVGNAMGQSKKTMYPNFQETSFGPSEYNDPSAQIHTGRYDLELSTFTMNVTIRWLTSPVTGTFTHIDNGTSPGGRIIYRGRILESIDATLEWDQDVQADFICDDNQSGFDKGFNEGQLYPGVLDYVSDTLNVSSQSVNYIATTFGGGIVAKSSSSQQIVGSHGPGKVWFKLVHDGPDSVVIGTPPNDKIYYPANQNFQYTPEKIILTAPPF